MLLFKIFVMLESFFSFANWKIFQRAWHFWQMEKIPLVRLKLSISKNRYMRNLKRASRHEQITATSISRERERSVLSRSPASQRGDSSHLAVSFSRPRGFEERKEKKKNLSLARAGVQRTGKTKIRQDLEPYRWLSRSLDCRIPLNLDGQRTRVFHDH